MRYLDMTAAVGGLCAFGLALYEALAKEEYSAAGICFGVFVVCCIAFLWLRKRKGTEAAVNQAQRSGKNSVNIQAGRDINIASPENPHVALTEPLRQEHRRQIDAWRAMVTEVHSKQTRSSARRGPRSITALLEEHPDFLSLRPYLSTTTKKHLWGRTFLVPPDGSTMDGGLYAVLADIERLEREWGLLKAHGGE